MKKILILILMTILLSSVAVLALESVILSDQGSGVKYKTNGSVASGDLEVTIWNTSQSTGTPIYNETFANAIVNGSWHVILGENSSNNLTLEYMGLYYKDYKIAGEDADFGQYNGSATERQVFNSPLGDIKAASFNKSSDLNVSNMTVAARITFALGESIDNVLDGLIAITGDLQTSGVLTTLGGKLTLGSTLSQINSTNPTANITISTANTNEVMRLTANKRVGINNSNPSNTLEVNGTFGLSSGATANRSFTFDPDAQTLEVGAGGNLTITNSSSSGNTMITFVPATAIPEFGIALQLIEQANSPGPGCSSATIGTIFFNSSDNTFYGCNDSAWTKLGETNENNNY